MAGETATLEVAPGVEMELTKFSPEENKKYDRDYPKVTAIYTKQSVLNGKHIIADWFDESNEVFRLIAQACKHDIQPSAGVFQGMRAQTGFGFRMIRPDDLVPTAQGRTFDCPDTVVMVKDSWYGLYHNAATGAAYNATPLYLRKELGIGWIGMQELQPIPMVDEMQIELNGKPLPIFNMLQQMGRANVPQTAVAYAGGTGQSGPVTLQEQKSFRFPQVEYMKPAIQYRSQFKVNAVALSGVWGQISMTPIGLTFVTADYARNTIPTQPSTTAP